MTNLMSERARRMRRDKEPAERRLWYWLRELNSRGFHFRQQAPIGPYIADFCDHTAKLVIEVDGSQHGELVRLVRDRRRTRWLELQGYRVLRFWNHEVLANIGGVEVEIMLALGLISEDETREIRMDVTSSTDERLRKKARGLARLRVNATRPSRRRASRTVPSPLVGEGQGGGDSRTSDVLVPPTPNPSPQGGGESAGCLRLASASISGERDNA